MFDISILLMAMNCGDPTAIGLATAVFEGDETALYLLSDYLQEIGLIWFN